MFFYSLTHFLVRKSIEVTKTAKGMKATPPASPGNTLCWVVFLAGRLLLEHSICRAMRVGGVPAKIYLPPIASEASL